MSTPDTLDPPLWALKMLYILYIALVVPLTTAGEANKSVGGSLNFTTLRVTNFQILFTAGSQNPFSRDLNKTYTKLMKNALKNVLQLLYIIAHEMMVSNLVSEYTHGPWKVRLCKDAGTPANECTNEWI